MKATAKHRLETLFAIDCPWTPVLGQAWMSFAIFLGIFSFSSQAQLISVTTEVDTAFYAPAGDGFDPEGLLDGYVTYGVYANFTNLTDELSAMYADVVVLGTPPLYMNAPCGCFNPLLGDVLLGSQQNPAIVAAFPESEFDTFWTLGFALGEQFTSTNPDYSSTTMCSEQIEGGLIFTVSPVAAGDDLRIQIAQVTTCGDFEFQACFQVFVEGVQAPYQEWCMEGDGDGPMSVLSPCAQFAAENSAVEVLAEIECFGDLAIVDIIADGASASPVVYELFDAETDELLATQEDNITFSNLGAGEYYVAIVDDNTCRDTTDLFAFVNPAELNANWTLVQDNTCPGVLNSIVQINSQGGTEPLEIIAYSAENVNNGQPPNAMDQWVGLPCPNGNGDWLFQIQDFYGCLLDTSITLSCLEPFVLDLESIDISCFDYGDGQIDGLMSGGSGTLTLTAVPPLPEIVEGEGDVIVDLDNVLPGQYTITLEDDNGCTTETQLGLIEPDPVAIALMTSDLLCADACTGAVDIDATGGTGNFDYSVTDDDGDEFDANVLCEGNFMANAVDENGCIVTSNFMILAPDSITFDLVVTDVSCAGESDGEICILDAQGGTGSLTYEVNPPADGYGLETCFDLAVGTYTLSVMDEVGCVVSSDPQTLIEPEPIQLILISTAISCTSFADGLLSVDAVGGTGMLMLIGPESGDLPYTIEGLDEGDHEVTVQDENGCEVSGLEYVFEPDSLVVEWLLAEDVVCGGDCDGSVVIDFSGGTGNIMLTLNGSEDFNVNALCASLYTTNVIDDNGCLDSTMFEILEPEPIEVLMNVTDVTCTGMSDGEVNVFPIGGTGELSWTIEELGIDLFNLYEGQYHVTAVDETGCVEDTTFAVGAEEDTDMILTMLSSPVTCWNEQDGTATASIAGGHLPIEYLWSDPFAQGTATATGLYEDTYSVVITDSLGCTLTSTVTVDPTIGCFFIADAITPNGDGYNDEWIVGGLEFFPTSSVRVFNRWGQELFYSLGYSKKWDGRYNNAPLPVADYYYVIEFSDDQDPITGTVTLKY